MSVLRLAVPLALLAVFLWNAMSSPLCLLGIPFMQLMGSSVFIERLRIFTIGASLGAQVPIMVWLVFIWIVCGAIRSRSGERRRELLTRPAFRLLPEEALLLFVGVIACVHVLREFTLSGDMQSALGGALGFLSMIVGYFVVRDIVCSATRSEVVHFLGLVVIANTVAAALFVLHQGLHVHVYGHVEYSTVVFHGTLITRSFWFAPQLSGLSLAYVLARREWTGPWLTVLVITALSVWVSYTRTLVLIVIVAVVAALLVRETKRLDFARFLRRAIGIVAVGVAMLWVVLAALPTESAFFGQRVSELSSGLSGSGFADWNVRVNHFVSAEKAVARKDVLFGAGFPSPPSAEADTVHRWSADMAWIAVVYNLGIAGVVLFGLIFVWSGARAYRLFVARSGAGEYLELVYLITLLATFLNTLISWVFMQTDFYPMGLWFFAFMAAEALRQAPSDTATEWPLAAKAKHTRPLIP